MRLKWEILRPKAKGNEEGKQRDRMVETGKRGIKVTRQRNRVGTECRGIAECEKAMIFIRRKRF